MCSLDATSSYKLIRRLLLVGLGRFLGLDGFGSALELLLLVCDSVSPIWFLTIYRSIEAHVHDALKGWEDPPFLEKRTGESVVY